MYVQSWQVLMGSNNIFELNRSWEIVRSEKSYVKFLLLRLYVTNY